jgi:hypothetical protein
MTSSASAPLPASRTSKPAATKILDRMIRIARESSTANAIGMLEFLG